MLEKVLRRSIIVRGRALEVMLEVEGTWRGIVHISDTSLPKAQNQDVLVSGAKYKFDEHTIVVDVENDVMIKDLDFIAEALAHAAISLRIALSN